jgi:hypothetical protein
MGQVPDLALSDDLLDLQALLRVEWPARSAALRASGVPLMEGDGGDGDGDGGDGDGGDGDGADGGDQKPPWGSDDDFKPDKAWKLIENVRADQKKTKAALDEALGKLKTHEDATKTEKERADERAAEAERQAKGATLEAARLRVALKKGLTETQAKRLVGDTEEDLEKDADELLESFKNDDDRQDPDPHRRPQPRLRPGAAPSAKREENDPAKLAAEVGRGW